jgi:hypothetical protein
MTNLPDELDITALTEGNTDEDYVEQGQQAGKLIDAIDAASDQDHVTWLTSNGKRIAAIVPVDIAEHGSVQAVLNRFARPQPMMIGTLSTLPCPECRRPGTHKMDCSRRGS